MNRRGFLGLFPALATPIVAVVAPPTVKAVEPVEEPSDTLTADDFAVGEVRIVENAEYRTSGNREFDVFDGKSSDRNHTSWFLYLRNWGDVTTVKFSPGGYTKSCQAQDVAKHIDQITDVELIVIARDMIAKSKPEYIAKKFARRYVNNKFGK